MSEKITTPRMPSTQRLAKALSDRFTNFSIGLVEVVVVCSAFGGGSGVAAIRLRSGGKLLLEDEA